MMLPYVQSIMRQARVPRQKPTRSHGSTKQQHTHKPSKIPDADLQASSSADHAERCPFGGRMKHPVENGDSFRFWLGIESAPLILERVSSLGISINRYGGDGRQPWRC
jgi:hypothetical protein